MPPNSRPIQSCLARLKTARPQPCLHLNKPTTITTTTTTATTKRIACLRHLHSTRTHPRQQNAPSHKPPPTRLLESALPFSFTLKLILTTLSLSTLYLYATDTRASIHAWLISPILRLLYPDAEEAHTAGIKSLSALYSLNLHPRERSSEGTTLPTQVFTHTLNNPLAISAGLDKNGEAIDALFALGPSIVEIGGVTPLPQDGNAKPRVWRIPNQQAIINRYGLNSQGSAAVALNLRRRVRAFADAQGYGIGKEAEKAVLDGEAGVSPGSLIPGKLLAVQIAKNKNTPDADRDAVTRDYVSCVQALGVYADIIVVNVSSPNTPGLRDLQKTGPLTDILTGVVGAAKDVKRKSKPRVMVKVSPDESSESDIQGICMAVWKAGVDGVIVANTTKSRPSREATRALGTLSTEETRNLQEVGGYSGPVLFEKTRDLVERYREMLDKPLGTKRDAAQKVIFASGGICSGDDALEVLKAGASVAMIYTALSYRGSGHVTEMKRQMRKVIADDAAGGSGGGRDGSS